MRKWNLECVSCLWTLRTRDSKKAEREALRHMDENRYHFVTDNDPRALLLEPLEGKED